MKIGIIGATGKAGSKVVTEALARGHQVTALVRNAAKAKDLFGDNVTIVQKDAFAITKEDLTGLDAVVNAFSVPMGQHLAYQHIDLAAHLIHLLRGTETPRILFILGGGSLKTDSGLLVDELRKVPGAEAWIDTPESQYHELNFLKTVTNVNWVGVSPSQNFVEGPKTNYVLGQDQLLFDDEHHSEVSTGTMAAAILDELEHPTVHQARFTVRNN
ncbi:NAD(P)-dependent oxidoreductase [Pediococcus siamensis]|uniref:NAD(P)-dependent oxidoreductase n=1 Tax=Pediococcus siamensis TaxID=381829 RepID=UPI0039A30F7E